MMKRIMACGVMAAMLTACSDSWDETYSDKTFEGTMASALTVSVATMELPSQAGSQTIGIQTGGYWTAASTAAWLQLGSAMGRGSATLTLSTEDNTSTTQDRKATVTISNGITTQTVSVTQRAMVEELIADLPGLSHQFAFGGGTVAVGVQANVAWTVSSNADWLSVEKDDDAGGLTMTARQNVSTTPRSAKVIVKGVALVIEMNISQQAVTAPVIGALTVSGVTKHEAACTFDFASTDIDVTEYGVCYSTTAGTPSKNNAEVAARNGGGRGASATFALTGLKSKTKYYVRPYVETALGTQYGQTAEFTTPVSSPQEGDNGTPND